MSIIERIAYIRGMGEYLPLILFGSDGVRDDEKPLTAADVPGMQIVKAY